MGWKERGLSVCVRRRKREGKKWEKPVLLSLKLLHINASQIYWHPFFKDAYKKSLDIVLQ